TRYCAAMLPRCIGSRPKPLLGLRCLDRLTHVIGARDAPRYSSPRSAPGRDLPFPRSSTMPALRIPRRVLALAAPVAAAIAFTGVATAAPPQPLGTAITIGCINQGSLASFTSVTAQPGPDEGIPGGHVLFSTREALWPVPAAGQVSVAWLNRNNGRAGI